MARSPGSKRRASTATSNGTAAVSVPASEEGTRDEAERDQQRGGGEVEHSEPDELDPARAARRAARGARPAAAGSRRRAPPSRTPPPPPRGPRARALRTGRARPGDAGRGEEGEGAADRCPAQPTAGSEHHGRRARARASSGWAARPKASTARAALPSATRSTWLPASGSGPGSGRAGGDVQDGRGQQAQVVEERDDGVDDRDDREPGLPGVDRGLNSSSLPTKPVTGGMPTSESRLRPSAAVHHG